MSRRSARKALAALRTPLVVGNALLLAACADRLPTAAGPTGPSRTTYTAPGRYVVGLAPGAELGDDVLAAAGATVIDRAPAINALEVEVENPAALAEAAGVEYVGRSFEFTLDAQDGGSVAEDPAPADDATPAGTDASGAAWYASGVQWDMRAIGLTSAVWSGSSGGAGARACVIDSGIDEQHRSSAARSC
jgi:hypothetical protein